MPRPRFAWVGFHAEGLPALHALLGAGAPIAAVLTLTPELRAKRSGSVDYAPLCAEYGVPLHQITGINEPDAYAILERLAPDVIFVIGWHQIVRPPVMRLARVGLVGAHASCLPHNRGSAPINWAIIRGEQVTGNTLMWLAEGVDEGDIIAQRTFPISPYDTCATLYAQVAASNRDMLLELLPRLLKGERPGRPQERGTEAVLPRRKPADGRIAWDSPAPAVYDFVRALTRPYPGAFSVLDGKRWCVWEAALPPVVGSVGGAQPGDVLGPVVSPSASACGQLVACGSGAVILLELEDEHGTLLHGRTLSDQPWIGKRFGHEDVVPRLHAVEKDHG
ncbi:MAG TPA: methionyl-tRNA formyltransferase [Gemmatimonadales bacterium]|nr:methionyl-tRNA formyltransferase [Gemmatimonadales bacterium]